ncbi:MAG: ABC transporter ATP-binding protein/permease [Desulfohalobiaceae bacterium]|nr:ABC transporter ATP-binding protein/permease [Desulfohalobiaceae bacterium]
MNGFSLLKPYFREHKALILIGLASLIVVDVLQLLIPRVIKSAVDDITAFRIEPGALVIYALYIVGIALGMGLFRYLWRRCLLGTSRRVEEGLRNRLHSHIQSLSAPYFDRTETGDLMAHATNDIQQVRQATGMGLVALNDAVFLGLATAGFMAWISPRLTLLVLLPMPGIVLGTLFFTRRLHSRYQEVQRSFSGLTEVVRERFAGMRIVKAYNLEEAEAARVDRASSDYFQRNMHLVRTTGLFFPMMLFFTNLSLAVVLYAGGRQTITGTITAGDFVAFVNYLGLLTWPMMAMGWVINLIQRGRASLDRIGSILATPRDIRNPEKPRPLPEGPLSLAFDSVSFAYPGAQEQALNQVSFSLGPGRSLGLVGPPGGGKSTLLNLLPRLYDPDSGAVRLHGVDAREADLGQLRRLITGVPQDPFLFSGTIRENITFGQEEVSEEHLEQAVRKAQLWDTVHSLRDGLDSLVGERGVILSGGQKQRVALARAFLRGGSVLLLDDPVSQLDSQTGSAVLEALWREAAERTTVIVSHRLAAVRSADHILVLDNGAVAEEGTHDQLLRMEGYYSRTWQLQQLEEEIHAL